MADTGYRSPGTVVDDTTPGNLIWQNPANAKVSDNVYSNITGGLDGGVSHYLKATNFGFSIPDGATIDGIVVEIERYPSAASAVSDYRVRIVKSGYISATDRKKAGFWSTTQAYYIYGSSSDKWGETWAPAVINASNFGVALSVDVEEGRKKAYVDHVRIKVYYTEVALTNTKINIGDVFKDVDEIKINIGDSWKTVTKIQINIGDVWKTIFG